MSCTSVTPPQLETPGLQPVAPALQAPAVDSDSLPFVAARPAPPPPTAQLTLTRMPQAQSMGELREVRATVAAHFVSGELTVEWVDPSGSVYDRRLVTLEATDTQELSFELPVAGTLMQSASLTGTWQVRVLVGEATLAQAAFEVTQ